MISPTLASSNPSLILCHADSAPKAIIAVIYSPLAHMHSLPEVLTEEQKEKCLEKKCTGCLWANGECKLPEGKGGNASKEKCNSHDDGRKY